MMENKKESLFLLVGPTGVGKTSCSIELAKILNAEIISCDSMQIYRGMDIGTAKVTKEEMEDIPHHMIDIIEPYESYSVCRYIKEAKKVFEDIKRRGKNVLMVGGTGLYADSFANGTEFCENKSDDKIKNNLWKIYEEKGADYLHCLLMKEDEKSAQLIHKNNVKRVIRALEYFYLTGEKISDHNEEDSKKPSPYNVCAIALTRNRPELYERIDKRVDMMINEGLIDEVMNLYKNKINLSHNSMQALGYKEIIWYIQGKCTLSEAIRILKRDSRRYAKRQITWFKRNKDIKWINLSETDENPVDLCVQYYEEKMKNFHS